MKKKKTKAQVSKKVGRRVYIRDMPHEPIRLKNKGIEIEVRVDEKLLGRLSINKGKLTWWPGRSSVNGYSMSWNKFISAITEEKTVRNPFSMGPSIF